MFILVAAVAVVSVVSVPPLDLPGVVVGRGRAGELHRLAVQRGVSEQVAEVLEELQQLVRGVLEDGQHLRGHHVVHHEEGRLEGKRRGAQHRWVLAELQENDTSD